MKVGSVSSAKRRYVGEQGRLERIRDGAHLAVVNRHMRILEGQHKLGKIFVLSFISPIGLSYSELFVAHYT